MSSLWTPGGDHRGGDGTDDRADDLAGDLAEMDEEQIAQVAAQLDEVRRELANVPADQVIANHAMGLYELAAIHLGEQPAHFAEATLAIDAMAGLVEGLTGRLGDYEPTLRDALAQIRLAYVRLKARD